jgi:hypothetical protein
MNWFAGGSILAGCAILLRRLLGMGASKSVERRGLLPLSPERESIYQSIAQDLETQCTMMGITLNDAMNERDEGNSDIAWRLIRLCRDQWDRVMEILGLLLNVMGKYMPATRVVVPLRSISAQRYKSRTMTDFFRMYEFLDQLVFRSKLRFQLQTGILRRAAETLTNEFGRNYRYVARTGDASPELWSRLDFSFHDFDLLGKETLLAFRTFLACLPDPALAAFASDLATARARTEHTLPV